MSRRCSSSRDEYHKLADAFAVPRGEMIALSSAAANHVFCDRPTAAAVKARLFGDLAILDPTTAHQGAVNTSNNSPSKAKAGKQARRGRRGSVFGSMLAAAASAGSAAAGAAVAGGLAAGKTMGVVKKSDVKMADVKTEGARKMATAVKEKYHDSDKSIKDVFDEVGARPQEHYNALLLTV